MTRTLAGVLAGLMVLTFAGAASAGIPDPDASKVDLTGVDCLTTCPNGDGSIYQYVKVTAERADLTPIQGIPYTSIFFTVTGGAVTMTNIDAETDANGECRFTLQGDEAIIGTLTIEAQIYTVVLNDTDTLSMVSFDYNGDDYVELADFSTFSGDYLKTPVDPTSDFNCDGQVELADFSAFSGHYLHQ